MNDKLITYENLIRFYDDLNLDDIDELNYRINNLIKDTSTSNNSTWSSSKINSEIQAHSGETYTAGDNIYIDSNNVISAIFNLATTADIEALFGEPVPPSPAPTDDEIWYTTESGNLWEPYVDYGGDEPADTLLNVNDYGGTIISNTYANGHGTIKYNNSITSIDNDFGKSYPQLTDLTTLVLPNSITYVDAILGVSAPQLESIYYNGTVAECEQINWDSFDPYTANGIEEIICLDGTYSLEGGGGSGSGSGGSGSGNG